MKKTDMRIAALIVAVVLMLGVLTLSGCGDEEAKVLEEALEAVQDEDYETLAELLEEHDSLGESEELISALEKRLRKLESAYEDEQMEYEEVLAELEQIEDLGLSSLKKPLKQIRKTLETLFTERSKKTVRLMTSLTYVSYQYIDKTIGKSINTISYNYDEAGRLTEYGREFDFWRDGSYHSGYDTTMTYTYDSRGRIVEINSISEDSDGEIDTMQLTAGYEADRLTTYTGFMNDESAVVTFEYDENGNIGSRTLSRDGSMTVSWYAYDENNTLRLLCTPPSGMTIVDEKGRRVADIYLTTMTAIMFERNEYGHLTGQYQYVNIKDPSNFYESLDNIIQTITEEEPVDTLEVEYTYDEQGRVLSVAINENGETANGIFTDSGNIRTLALSGNSPTYGSMTIVLEYDDAGDLVADRRYKDGKIESEMLYTYVALELPADYKPNILEPIYMID